MPPIAVLSVSFLRATAPLPAQDPGAGLRSADEEMALKPFRTRPSSDARLELDLVRSRLEAAETEAAALGGMEKIAGVRVAVQKGEIDFLADRLGLAKEEKNAARVDALTAKIRRVERREAPRRTRRHPCRSPRHPGEREGRQGEVEGARRGRETRTVRRARHPGTDRGIFEGWATRFPSTSGARATSTHSPTNRGRARPSPGASSVSRVRCRDARGSPPSST